MPFETIQHGSNYYALGKNLKMDPMVTQNGSNCQATSWGGNDGQKAHRKQITKNMSEAWSENNKHNKKLYNSI